MKTLIGMWLTCSVSFTSYHPGLKRDVIMHAEDVKCQVLDDQIDPVGSPEWTRHPIVMDCRNAILWLKPTNTNGVFTFMKEDKDCDYGLE